MPSQMEIVRAAVAGFATGSEREALADAFDAGVEAGILAADLTMILDRSMPDFTSYRGREGFIECIRRWTEDFDTWSVELEDAVEAPPDRVAAVLRQRAKGSSSQAEVDLRHGALYSFRDGQLVRVELFLDPAEAFAAAGLPQAPK